MAGWGWSSLPADLLDKISGCLTYELDLLHVRQVCSYWRSCISLPIAPYRPWIVAVRPRAGPLGEYSLYLPNGLRRIHLAAPPGLPYCCSTPRGWLVLADVEQAPKQLVLWEPDSRTELLLPPLVRVIRVFLSGDPLASSGWMAVATQVRNEMYHNIFFWRPGDAAWTAAAEVYTCERLDSVAFLGGKMYCIDTRKKLAIYDLNPGSRSPPVLIQSMYVARRLNLLCNRRCGRRLHGTRAAHLVACNGEMLLVVLFYTGHPSFAEVYRPDLAPGRDLDLGERVTNLGGYSLFLGRGDAFALSAEEFPAIKKNCVYYAVHSRNFDKKDWLFVFDLESDVLHEFPFPPEVFYGTQYYFILVL